MAYRVYSINIRTGKQFTPEFLALNPNNKIPVIQDSDGSNGTPITLFKSGAILVYLADKMQRLLPASGTARYRPLQWLIFQMGGIGPMFGQMHYFRRNDAGQEFSLARFAAETHRLYRVLDSTLAKSEFVAREAYSIADIAIYPWVARFDLRQLDRPTAMPHVKRWCDTLGGSLAVRRRMEVAS